MNFEKIKIVVVGAGLGGLGVAISSALAGHEVEVLEATREISEIGAGLQITPNASKVLQSWGLSKEFWDSGAEPTSLSVHKYSGELLAHEEQYNVHMRSKYGAPFVDVHRADLQLAMYARAKELGVRFYLGEKVESIDFETSNVITGSGNKFNGDLIVGADGLWSRCREIFLNQKDEPLPTGDLAYRIVLTLDEIQDQDLRDWVSNPTVHFWIGPGAHAVGYSLRAGNMYNIVIVCPDTLPKNLSRQAGSVEEMKELFKNWDPILLRFLGHVKSVDKWKLMHHAEMAHWVNDNSNLVFVGDACHPMLPYLAQGANSSLEDGAVLGGLLAKLKSRQQLPQLLHLYESLRKQRGEAIVRETFKQRDDFHMEDGPKQRQRDELFRSKLGKDLGTDPFPSRWTCPQVQPWLYGYDAQKEVDQAQLDDPNAQSINIAEKMNGLSLKNNAVNGLNGINGVNGVNDVKGINGSNGIHNSLSSYTAAEALLEALVDADITHLFVNLGSDHPALLEAISKRRQEGRETLKIITAANEFVGLSACHGFFQASGKMQAILVHVDCGTLAMAGAIHNVARARIPVVMIAGTSPVTEENELMGSRNEFIHYLQDTIDQRGIVRGYTKFDHEIRTGKNIKQNVLRAAQLAMSEPQGPTYLTASREVLEEKVEPVQIVKKHWKPAAPAGLSPDSVTEIAEALISARNPCVITSYLGREPKAVSELITLVEALGIAVLEAVPSYLNFPHDHELYMGNQWSEGLKDGTMDTADVVLVLDCDVPWIKGVFRPSPLAKIYHIDTDALKIQMSLFHLPTELSCSVNAYVALQQLNAYLMTSKLSNPTSIIQERITVLKDRHEAYINRITSLETFPANEDVITPHYVLSRLRDLTPPDALFLSEGISNFRPIADVLRRSQPGTYFNSGATALGWHGGAAIGAKLANPSKTVIAITGDGTFLFSIPSTVHWMSRRYDAPFLTIILNNRGWKSPMLSAMACHKDGYSSQMGIDDLHVTFDPPPKHAEVAVAAGAGWGAIVKKASEVDEAIKKGLETVKNGRSAVLDIYLPKIVTGDRVG